jgi:hypothetical protein
MSAKFSPVVFSHIICTLFHSITLAEQPSQLLWRITDLNSTIENPSLFDWSNSTEPRASAADEIDQGSTRIPIDVSIRIGFSK